MSVGLAVQCKVLKSSYRQHIKVGKQKLRYVYRTKGHWFSFRYHKCNKLLGFVNGWIY